MIPHNKWTATRCPGNYDLNRLEQLVQNKLNPKPIEPPNPTKTVPGVVKLPKPIKYISKLQATEVWDLSTNPNYKSVKTLSLGEEFMAAGYFDFNNTRYYTTAYSISKGNPYGVNQNDLALYVEPKPPVVEPPTEKPDDGFTEDDRSVLKDIQKVVNAIWEAIKSIFKIKE